MKRTSGTIFHAGESTNMHTQFTPRWIQSIAGGTSSCARIIRNFFPGEGVHVLTNHSVLAFCTLPHYSWEGNFRVFWVDEWFEFFEMEPIIGRGRGGVR